MSRRLRLVASPCAAAAAALPQSILFLHLRSPNDIPHPCKIRHRVIIFITISEIFLKIYDCHLFTVCMPYLCIQDTSCMQCVSTVCILQGCHSKSNYDLRLFSHRDSRSSPYTARGSPFKNVSNPPSCKIHHIYIILCTHCVHLTWRGVYNIIYNIYTPLPARYDDTPCTRSE